MTTLPTKTVRDLLNIDTHERAIVYGALLLRSVNENDNILLTIIHNSSSVAIQGKINYDREASFKEGLNIPYHCLPISDHNPGSLNIGPCFPNGTKLNEPIEIDILEKYFIYHCFKLLDRLLFASNLEAKNIVKLTLNDKQKPPYIQVEVNLPFDYQSYLVSFNLIGSVSKLVNPLFQSDDNSYFNNTYYLNNNTYLNNGV